MSCRFIVPNMANAFLYLVGVAIAIAIALVFLFWVRRMELYHREPWSMVIYALVIGAIVAGAGAVILVLLGLPLDDFGDFQPFSATLQGVLVAILVAPIVEETVKAGSLVALRGRVVEPENGLVYGAAIGLGFAMMENILYFYGEVYSSGANGLAASVLIRTFTSTVMHMSTAAIAGFGVGMLLTKKKTGKAPWFSYVIAAIILHAIFNLFASASIMASDQLTKDFVNLISGAIVGGAVAWYALIFMRNKIKQLDLEKEIREEIGIG